MQRPEAHALETHSPRPGARAGRRLPGWLRGAALVLAACVPLTVFALPERSFSAGDPITAADFQALWDAVDEVQAQAHPQPEAPGEQYRSWWLGSRCWIDDDNTADAAVQVGKVYNLGSDQAKFGCDSTETGASRPRLHFFIDGIPDDVRITEWGFHMGQNGSDSDADWTCGLYAAPNADPIDTLTLNNLTESNWGFTASKASDLVVDHAATRAADGIVWGWQVRCVAGSDAPETRWFHAFTIKYQPL